MFLCRNPHKRGDQTCSSTDPADQCQIPKSLPVPSYRRAQSLDLLHNLHTRNVSRYLCFSNHPARPSSSKTTLNQNASYPMLFSPFSCPESSQDLDTLVPISLASLASLAIRNPLRGLDVVIRAHLALPLGSEVGRIMICASLALAAASRTISVSLALVVGRTISISLSLGVGGRTVCISLALAAIGVATALLVARSPSPSLGLESA